jgi:Ca-activated chloride channel family protein
MTSAYGNTLTRTEIEPMIPIQLLSRSLLRIAFPLGMLAFAWIVTPPASSAQDRDSTKQERIQTESGVGRGVDASPLDVGGSVSGPSFKAGGGMYRISAAPTLGATVGGAQDIGYTRQLIESGRVPQFLDFSPEGLYSEHDIPTPSADCDAKLCLSLGYGYAPTVDDHSNALFVHLGMSSGIRPDEFKRQPLQLALVIDKSGSMQGASMDAVKHALRSLLDRLTPDDELALVEFNNSATLLLPPTRITARDSILAAIDALHAYGGTNIEAGLQMGFAELAKLPAREGVSKRLMLFTDAMPNVGRTDSAGFRTLTQRYADQGIGMSAFGVGVNFGQELVYHISKLRGGNFFFLETPEKIAKVFEQEFDYLVTPLVYDLKVRIETPQGLKLKAVYGLPTWKPGSRDAELEIPTVFLSSNRGAIVLRYERDGDGPLALAGGSLIATGSLSYTDVDGSDHSQQTVLRSSSSLQPGTQFYTHEGMRMAVALTNIFFGLRDACLLVTQGKKDSALDVIKQAKAVASLENLYLTDRELSKEIRLLDRLAENIRSGAVVRKNEGGE